MGDKVPDHLDILGNSALLQSPLLGLLGSVKCPGSLILKTYDLARALSQAGTPTISGFHSPVEKEALVGLMRGNQPVVICLARGLQGLRIPQDYRKPLEARRLLLVSPFPGKIKRPTQKLTVERNRIVGALAEKILVIHATPGGKMEGLCKEFLEWEKPVYTLADEANTNLIAIGAKVFENI